MSIHLPEGDFTPSGSVGGGCAGAGCLVIFALFQLLILLGVIWPESGPSGKMGAAFFLTIIFLPSIIGALARLFRK